MEREKERKGERSRPKSRKHEANERINVVGGGCGDACTRKRNK